jgi:hypothetical protein
LRVAEPLGLQGQSHAQPAFEGWTGCLVHSTYERSTHDI